MKKFYFITFFLFLTILLKSQFVVSVKTEDFSDTLKTCTDLEVTFIANATYDGEPIIDLNYKWDFDDGTVFQDINLDTVNYFFTEKRLHRVLLTVWNDTINTYTIFPVLIGVKPDFSETSINPNDVNSFCKGEEIMLIGKANINKFKEKRENRKIEDFPQFINHTNTLNSVLNLRHFDVNQLVTTETNIDSIGIYIEHSKISDLQISIKCPSDSIIILKDFGGDENIFGTPIFEITNPNPGTGEWYYWTVNPLNSTMNSVPGPVTLQSSTYLSDSSLTKLIGCQLNGDWAMKVIDQNSDDQNGYFFAWHLSFDDEIENDVIEYSFPLEKIFWELGTTSSEGIAKIELVNYGSNSLKLFAKDIYECETDTSIIVNVTKPEIFIDFDPASEQKYIGDSIKLEDKTEWAESRIWIFDDGSDDETESIIHKMYLDSSTYKIVLKSVSKSGCFDKDTLELNIIQRPIVLGDYNIFTPNEDGVNDVFVFFVSEEEKKVAYSIEEVDGRVYNRYGDVVCKWSSPEQLLEGWNGTINNAGFFSCPSGFYYYVIIIKQKGEKPKKQTPIKGTIYLYKN